MSGQVQSSGLERKCDSMREKLWRIIHQLDLRIDSINDALLLTLAAGIRECLVDMLKDHAAGLVCDEWGKSCLTMLSNAFMKRTDREKILYFLKLTEGPDTSLCESIDVETPEEMRALCEMQRDRICFFQAMKPLRSTMIRQLPEAERIEEEQRAGTRETMLNEQFDNLLMLYQKASIMQQNSFHSRQFQLSLRNELPEKIKQELTEKATQIRINQDYLQNSREDFDKFYTEQRIFGEYPGYLMCKDTERRMKTHANQRTSAEKEECRDQEGNQESSALQTAHPQYGDWREKHAPGYRIHETESD